MHIYKFFTLKHLKSLQHVSSINHLQGATLFLAKVTFFFKHSLTNFLILTFWRRNYFFNFSTPVYKM